MGLITVAEQRLQQAFADVGTLAAGDFYVPPFVAGEFVDTCIRESLAIIGVDVFRLEEGVGVKPDLSQMADFSSMFPADAPWLDMVRATAEEARRFVEQLPLENDVRLNFTVLSEEESQRLRSP
ncbi:MAG: hypothetical protein ACO1OB_24695 [Archangium sp.]